MLKVADVIEALTSKRPGWGNLDISGAAHDSRLVEANNLFVALKGEKVNGHNFVAKAFKQGALIALTEQKIEGDFTTIDLRKGFDIQNVADNYPLCIQVENSLEALQQIARFWRRQLDIRVIGITGSVGKTTSKESIAEVLSQKFKTFKSKGNFNNEIGLPISILGVNEKHQRAILEMGFYVPGEIKFLADLALPQVGVVTTVGLVHAERAGSQEAIYEGKKELIQALPKDGTAILNYDDPLVKKMAKECAAEVVFYGLDSRADLWADEIEGLGLDGVRFRLHYENEILHVRIPMIGRHSVHTALRSAAVGLVEGLDWQNILTGLRIGNPQLRLVASKGQNGAILLDDTYNASPDSTVAALNLLDELEGHKVAVLGDMLELGQYELQGHQMVGNLAAKVADILITIGERAKIIAEEARRSGLNGKSIKEFDTSEDALHYLKEILSSKDVVLVKGSRAMKMDNIVPMLEAQA